MNEQVTQFGEANNLVGIVTDPPAANRRLLPAVVLLGAGFIHRVGPNRLNVKLARRLAARGFTVLRFDLAGFGDSVPSSLPLAESAIRDTLAAMDFLEASRGSREFLLIGLCSGATCASHAAWLDRRVVGAALLNPRPRDIDLFSWMHQQSILRKYRRLSYWDPAAFVRTVAWKGSLRKAWRIGRTLVRTPRGTTNERDKFAEIAAVGSRWHALAERGTRLLLVASEWDQAWDYLERIRADSHFAPAMHEAIALRTIPGADHTFTFTEQQNLMFAELDDWLSAWTPERD